MMIVGVAVVMAADVRGVSTADFAENSVAIAADFRGLPWLVPHSLPRTEPRLVPWTQPWHLPWKCHEPWHLPWKDAEFREFPR